MINSSFESLPRDICSPAGGVQLDQRSRQGDNEAHPWVIPPLRMPDGWSDICVPDGWTAFHKTRSWKVIHATVFSLKRKWHFYENFITGTDSCHFDNLRSDENLIKRTYLFQVVVDGYLGAMMSLNRIISHENKGGDYPSRVQWEHTFTGDPLHSRAACTQPCNVNTHSRAHCSPGAQLCEQWGHGCVNNGARLCASARLCRGSPVTLPGSTIFRTDHITMTS